MVNLNIFLFREEVGFFSPLSWHVIFLIRNDDRDLKCIVVLTFCLYVTLSLLASVIHAIFMSHKIHQQFRLISHPY